ncbi:GvpL/GvpF family gas vesicle protein [Streptomyces lushanensis]|uniref:GvpL/GvpF family gas vesicle protein n=1 Tax=Streptomyces lushanensis TaxID=1434255 RepID=UPI00082BFE81|nr:GvpL/GvpF family gas vesicle protein [Streptomyces lushanensis]
MSADMTYSYAVTRADATPDALDEELRRVRGVAGAPVRLVRAHGLAAVASPVPARDFDESALKDRLEDMEWLESVARAHHAVVETVFARTTVLPLRLATLHLDDDRVRDMLARRAEEFRTLLGRLDGQVEWGVKVYALPPPAGSPVPAATAGSAGGSPGRDYLRGRQRQRRSGEDAWRAARDAVLRVDAEARVLAVERVQHRLQQGELATGPGYNVTNDAYLVPRGSGDDFRARVEGAAEGLGGIRVETTGPWAPYSFTAPEHTDDDIREETERARRQETESGTDAADEEVGAP